jgi:tripartite-type tricarboxylate transporter receptor subunit TctC
MNGNIRKIWTVLLLTALALAMGASALAASSDPAYPTRPIKLIITHGAGGSADTQSRMIAPYIEKYLGQSVVTENMEGAGGRKSRAAVYKMDPDGYTILITGFPSTVVGQLLYKGDYKADQFTYLHGVIEGDYSVVAVADANPIKTYKELVEMSKKKPIKLSTAGTGTTDHLAAVMLKRYTGLQFDLVPFDGTADQITALLGNKVAVMMDAVSTTGVRSDIRALVVLANKRSDMLPTVPALGEAGYPNLEMVYALGLVAPPGLAESKRKILEDAIDKAVKDPQYQAKLKVNKSIPSLMKGADFLKLVKTQFQMVQDVMPLLEADIKR